MAKAKSVVNGATLTCTQAQTPNQGSLTILPTRKCKAESQGCGIVTDTTPLTTVGTMGTCNIISGGNPGPCVPVIPGSWTPGALKNKCEGTAMIKDTDTVVCSVGGTVSVNNAGQTKVDIE